MPVLSAVLFGSCVIFYAELKAQEATTNASREWSDISGQFRIMASLVRADEFNVELRKESGELVKVPRRRLAANDNDYIEATEAITDTTPVIAMVADIMEKALVQLDELESNSGSSRGSDATRSSRTSTSNVNAATAQSVARHHQIIDSLAAQFVVLHNENKNVVTGFLGGTLLAIGKDARTGSIGLLAPVRTDGRKLKEAEKYLEEGLVRLRRLQKHFPRENPTALASALNNRAIVAIKRGQKGKAAALLIEAAEVTDQSQLATIHNATLLLSLSSQKNPLFELATSQQQLLQSRVAVITSKDPDPGLPHRFFYSSTYTNAERDVNRQNQGNLSETLRRLEMWPELTCFICSGIGHVGCQHCVRGAIAFKSRQQLGVNVLGEPIYGDVVHRKRCEHCKGVGALKCSQCRQGQITLWD